MKLKQYIYPKVASFLHLTTLPIPYVVRSFFLDHLPGHSEKFTAAIKNTPILMTLDLRDGLQNYIFKSGVYEPDISSWCAFFASKSRVILDIGAHCGYFSLVAAHFSGAASQVVAFEPNPHVYRLLRENIKRNKLQHRVRVIEAACGEANQERIMFFPRSYNLGTGSFARIKHFGFTKEVKVLSLDDYLNEYGLKEVDFLKMDIEGGEWYAMQGMQRGLRNGDYKVIFLDLHRDLIRALGGDIREIIRTLHSFNYVMCQVRAKELLLTEGKVGDGGGYICLIREDVSSKMFGQQKILPLKEPFNSMFA